ncbi:nuclear transport factor 2 family protein [Xylophilus sp. GOD-11R]|uniref:nuclear transport factor 2 family protein n=1 Tax=Xylophilus sp. GOD-11R TaxID=3089814 RepID=UPI00298D2026|nr:nuclear transport factor 2 family protein [Xylophilus sp. GOD-11R]WPB55906.1 nuclear transport factor 2 family protein [Xylophilus sp. GOD-11R]
MTEFPQDDPRRQTLLESHRRRADSLLRNDADALAALLDDRLVFVHANGRTESKTELVSSLREARLRYDSVQMLDSRVSLLGDIALIEGELHARIFARGEQKTLATAFCSTWIGGDGGWKLLAYAATPLPKAAP